MKIRNIINSTIALFMVLTFASCDALDLKPISFITNESFWQTEDDVKGALNGIYVQLRGAAEHDLYILGEARSEILTVGIGGYGGYDIYYYNTLTQANMPISWIRYYQIVNSCNLLLKYAPNVTFNNETSRNKMLAQAYTMRAFMYFVMTRTWGDLIIHTDPIENTNTSAKSGCKRSLSVLIEFKAFNAVSISLLPPFIFFPLQRYTSAFKANVAGFDHIAL